MTGVQTCALPIWLSFEEEGIDTLYANAYTISAIRSLGDNKSKILYQFKDFGNISDRHVYTFEHATKFMGVDRLVFNHGYASENTAKALVAKVNYFWEGITLSKNIFWDLTTNLRYQYSDYSDGNNRNALKASILYPLKLIPGL